MEAYKSKWHCFLAVDSRRGGRNENQDFCAFADTSFGLLAVVCDGMGGGPSGLTASTLAAQAVVKFVRGAPQAHTPDKVLHEALIEANSLLRRQIREFPQLMGMGTTCVAVLITPARAVVAHIGDSRLYHLRCGKVMFRTADHSVVGEFVRKGEITEEDARRAEMSNVITRAIGISDTIELEINVITLKPNDRIVLCTDGVWGEMSETQLVQRFNASTDLSSLISVLMDDIERQAKEEYDNLSLCMIELNAPKSKSSKGLYIFKFVIPYVFILSLALNIYLLFRPKETILINYTNDNPKEDIKPVEQVDDEHLLLEFEKRKNKDYEDSISNLKKKLDDKQVNRKPQYLEDILEDVRRLKGKSHGDVKEILRQKRQRQNKIIENIRKCKSQYSQNIQTLKAVENMVRSGKIVETKKDGSPSKEAERMINTITKDLDNIDN